MALNFLRQLGGSAGVHPAGMGSHTAMAGSPAAGAAPLGTPGRGGGGALMMGGGGPISGAAGMAGGAAPLQTPGLGAAGVGGAAPLGAGPMGGPHGGGFLQMGLGGGDLLTGSDFAMNRESRGGILSFWSRGRSRTSRGARARCRSAATCARPCSGPTTRRGRWWRGCRCRTAGVWASTPAPPAARWPRR